MASRLFTPRLAANYFSTLSFVGLSYWIITRLSSFHIGILQAQFQLGESSVTIQWLLRALFALYIVILIPYYVAYPWLHSKAFVFVQGLRFALLRLRRGPSRARRAALAAQPWRLPFRAGFSPAAKQATLSLLLKFFFAPLMINWCLGHAADMTESIGHVFSSINAGLRGRPLFDASIYWASFQTILFVDTFLFTIGYIVEIPVLGNRIRSVDPTFFGWFICLVCYPPFNSFTSHFLPWQSSDSPHFASNVIHYIACIVLLLSMAIYSWSSVELGFKASNLTNRGIVRGGPYSVVRHPAYVAKNFAWWTGALPGLYVVFSAGKWKESVFAVMALAGWSLIYALRAMTEERHLLMGNNGYAEYMDRVKWRFIPGVI
jgi:protein-S-isoprenylcysteine O-methyltransferase Ste14